MSFRNNVIIFLVLISSLFMITPIAIILFRKLLRTKWVWTAHENEAIEVNKRHGLFMVRFIHGKLARGEGKKSVL